MNPLFLFHLLLWCTLINDAALTTWFLLFNLVPLMALSMSAGWAT
jgi:hypothetical protein